MNLPLDSLDTIRCKKIKTLYAKVLYRSCFMVTR